MEENELEEGEACSEQEEDEEDSCIDPDIALSYIDEKLQDVLGHFQKDFEGGVSAENLGAKFGGYGSFLPTYQRSPSILSQSKSPSRTANHNASRSPCAPSFEGTVKSPSIQMGPSHCKNNTACAPTLDNSSKKVMGTNTHNNEEPIPQHDSLNKPVNGSDQKTLKVRIKVGPDNLLTRNNAAIYSGLGLDMSPSSSPEDSPDWSGGLSLQFHHMPDESPRTILQMMTCSPIPGVILLSPLQVSLFQLTKKDDAFIKNKTCMLYEGIPDKCAVLGDLTLPVKDIKCDSEKKMKSSKKRGKSTEVKNSKFKDDINVILNREIDIETPAGQELVSDALKTQSALKDSDRKAERQIVRDSVKGVTGMLDHSEEAKKITVKERTPSPDLVRVKQMESMESMENNGVGNLGNETTYSRGKLNSNTIMAEKDLEERNTSSHKGTSFDLQRENRNKVEKNYDLVNANSNILKGRKEHMAGPVNHIKHISSQKVTSCEQEGEKIFQGKDQLFEGKRKLKGIQTDAAPLVELSKDNMSGQSSASLKENKKNSHSKVNHSEKKSKVSKSCIDLTKGSFTESCDDAIGYDVNQEQLESGTGLPDSHYKYKPKVLNYEHEKEPFISVETSKGMSGGKKVDNPPVSDISVNVSTAMPSMGNAPASGAPAAAHAPVVIKENWVCCDICQQWRLLPYGANPDHLPKNWQCSLLSWLPRMNSCKFSEEETTKALNALYLIPVHESGANLEGHHNVAASNITSNNALYLNQKLEHKTPSVPVIGKRKTGPKDASNVLNRSTQFSNPVKGKHEASNKSRSPNDANQAPFETNLLDKAGPSHASKSNDFTAEKQKQKQKEKYKNLGCYSNGGDFIEGSEKHWKPKSKREADQNDFRAFKKIKKEGSHYPVKDCYPDDDIAGKAGTYMVNGLSTKVVNNLQKHGDVSLSKDLKSKSKGSLSSLSKRLSDEVKFLPDGEIKEQCNALDVEKSKKLDLAAKKKKLKEWKDDQHSQEAQATVNEVLSKTEMLKLKKARVSKPEGKESSTGRMDKKCSSTRIVLPASREHLSDGMDEEGRYAVGQAHQLGLCQGNATSGQVLDLIDPLKRDIAYAQASTAATSSSSKVSSTQKTKANFQEPKGSPVESVSSSPLRLLNTEKLFNKTNSVVKDGALNVGSSVLGCAKSCSDGEADGGSNRSGKCRKKTACSAQQQHIENHRAVDSGVLNPVRGSSYHQDREANKLPHGKAEVEMHLKKVSHRDLSPTEFEEVNVVSATNNFMDWHTGYPHGHPYKDHIQDLEKLNKHPQVNGSGQQKSGKNSSSRFNDRHRNFKADSDNRKLKVSGSSSGNKDSYFMKSDSGCQQMVDLDSHQHSTYLEDLRDRNYNFLDKDEKDFSGKKDSATRCSSVKRDNGVQENLDTHGPSVLYNQHKHHDSRVAVLGAGCGKSNILDDLQPASSYNEGKSSNHIISNLIDQGELLAKTGKVHSILVSGDKEETHNRSPQNFSPVKGSRSELSSKDAGNTGASTASKHSSQPDIQNGGHHNFMRLATPNGPDTSSPIRKDSHCTANIVMKEARNLKHTANRLKSEGLELESTGLYFQAALKFLHCASLMEPLSFDSAKQGDAPRSMQMYFETAKLCEFCAHEYERCKEMAAAALAYKCVEVAYLKSAYYRHPSASKDQHELQTTLQILQPGESPSSSSSDVDNLNNQGTLGKATSARGVNSPHVAGTHVIAARNHHHVMRLLGYTNDLNCAFEATRKSQIAIAAASVSLEKERADGVSSVRKVLDFNFHNVEGLLRLVRLSMESIGR